jgi:hypothetical protein
MTFFGYCKSFAIVGKFLALLFKGNSVIPPFTHRLWAWLEHIAQTQSALAKSELLM